MNQNAKNIFIRDCDRYLLFIDALSSEYPLLIETSLLTDSGNLHAIFHAMKYFLKNGETPCESLLPAVIFIEPSVQTFLQEVSGGVLTSKDLDGMSAAYYLAFEATYAQKT